MYSREAIKQNLQVCNKVLNKAKCVNQEYQLFEQLALSYLTSENHHDYPKAVGIYEYMKYLNNSKEKELAQRILRAEEKFLQKINGCPEKIKSTKQYVDRLKSFRDGLSKELTKVDHAAMKKIHLKTRKFIIGEIIVPLIDSCIEELGGLPKVNDRGARYSIFCTGSIALGTMTPWSDLEFGILLEDGLEDYTRVKAYFINLTHLLNIKVLSFGGNVLHYQGIKELNDFSTGSREDDWFVDTITTKGFCFDATLPDGSKTPLGRKDCYGTKYYELIGTTEELCALQEENWHETDGSLVQALNHVKFIHGDEGFFQNEYLKGLEEFSEINRERAFKILKEDAEKLSPENELTDQYREGTILNVKKEIYRFPDRMIVALGDCLGGEGDTTWDVIDDLVTKGKLKSTAAENLTYALNIATELRLRTYSNNKGRKEDISALARYDSSIKELQQNAKLAESVFYLQDLEPLYKYYYVVVSLSYALGGAKKNTELEEIISKCSSFYSNTPMIKGYVYKRFLQYYKAIEKFEKAEKSAFVNTELSVLYQVVGRYKDALTALTEIWKDMNKSDSSELVWCLNNIGDAYQSLGQYQEALLHHQKGLAIGKRIYKGDHASVAASLNAIGATYQILGRYQKALQYHQESLALEIRIYKGDHANVATFLNNVGLTYASLGQYQQALKYYQESLAMMRRIFKGDHANIAGSLNNIGNTYQILGQYQEALYHYQKSLKMRKRIFKDDHANIAGSLNNIGNTYQILGQYQEALRYYQESLAMNKSIHKGNHVYIAASLNNLGLTYASLGQHQEALLHHQESLAMMRSIFKGDHASVANSLNNMGLIYQSLGQYQEALQYHQESLAMRKRIYNGDHIDVATSLNNMGLIYQSLGQYQEALQYHQESLAMRKRIYNGDHIDVATSLNNIGTAYEKLEQHQQALQHCQESLAMMRRIFKGDNAYVASFLNNIGIAYKKLGQYQQALQPHQESLAMMRRIFKGDHAYVADSLNSIGVIYERLGRYQEALQHYQESLATRKRIFKSDHAYVANSLQNLGLTYAILGQYQQALTHQEEGLAMRKRICKGDHADIAVSLINIGMTYEKLEQYEKALPYAEEAAAMFKKLLPPDHQYVVMSCKLLEIYEARIMPQRASLLSNNNVSLIRVPIGKQQVTMLLCFLTGKAFKAYLRNDNSYIVDAIFKIECISAPSDYVRSLSKKHNIEFSWEEVDAGGYNIILKGVNLEEAGKLVTQRYKEQQRLR